MLDKSLCHAIQHTRSREWQIHCTKANAELCSFIKVQSNPVICIVNLPNLFM